MFTAQHNCTFLAILLGSKFAYNAYKLNYLKDIFTSPNRVTREEFCKYVEQRKTIIIINCE